MEQLTDAHLRYLLTIYTLSKKVLDVGVADVAKAMHVSTPSVTRMLGVLMNKGLLVRERYGKIYLTDQGAIQAKRYGQRVEEFKTRIPSMGLHLTEDQCREAACLLAAALPESVLR